MPNHNYDKILKSDWLSIALISALIGQFNGTVRVTSKQLESTRHRARGNGFSFSLLTKKILEFLVF